PGSDSRADSRLVHACSRITDDRCRDVLTEGGMGDGEHRGLADLRVGQQRLLYLSRRDLFPTTIDQLLQSAGQGQETRIIENAPVTCAQPTVDEGCGVGVRVIEVTSHHPGPADDHLARFTGRTPRSGLVEDSDLA